MKHIIAAFGFIYKNLRTTLMISVSKRLIRIIVVIGK